MLLHYNTLRYNGNDLCTHKTQQASIISTTQTKTILDAGHHNLTQEKVLYI